MNAEGVRDLLLGDASDTLAVKHQDLADRSARGKDTRAVMTEVSAALNRVEALQDGVVYRHPETSKEKEVSDAAARIIVRMLDGPNAVEKHRVDVLSLLDEIRDLIPEDESDRRFVILRQGMPYQETGRVERTSPTRFDNARIVKGAKGYEEAIEKMIERGDEDNDPYGKWPPVVDGEILAVLEIKNHNVSTEGAWIERIRRPVFQGEAPRNNTEDPRWA